MCSKEGEPEILGNNINDYQTPVPVKWGVWKGLQVWGVSRVILVGFLRGLGMFLMVLVNLET